MTPITINLILILITIVVFLISYSVYRKLKCWNEVRIKIQPIPTIHKKGKGKFIQLKANLNIGRNSPARLFQRIRSFHKIHSTITVWIMSIPIVKTILPENIEIILNSKSHTDKGLFYGYMHDWLQEGLVTSSGEKWQNRRKILGQSFHYNILQRYLDVFIERTKQVIKSLEAECENESTNINPYIHNFTLHSICETAMGITLNEEDTADFGYTEALHKMTKYLFYRISHPWLLPWFTFIFTPTYWAQRETIKILHKFTAKVISDRKRTFDPSKFQSSINEQEVSYCRKKKLALLDTLLFAKSQGADIDDKGIQEEVDTFMFGGQDTTATCSTFLFMLLANNRDCQDKVYEELYSVFGDSDRDPTYQDLQELKYMERCIKETLRLYPSIPEIARTLGENVITHEGYTLPKGLLVNFSIYDLHRQEYLYPDAEKFDPDRFLPANCAARHPYAFIPFSAGPRNCLGQKFSLLELKCLISGILRNYVLYPVDTPQTITLITDTILRTDNNTIRVHLRRRKHQNNLNNNATFY